MAEETQEVLRLGIEKLLRDYDTVWQQLRVYSDPQERKADMEATVRVLSRHQVGCERERLDFLIGRDNMQSGINQLSFKGTVEIPLKVMALCELYLEHFPQDKEIGELYKKFADSYTEEFRRRLAECCEIKTG